MEVENLVKASVDEIQKVLSSTSVMGEPKTIEGVVLVPLFSTGFFFGAGGGGGKVDTPGKDTGEGGGTAGGVGIKPIAVVIIDKSGVRVEAAMKGGLASAVEKIAEKAPELVGQVMDKKREQKEAKKQG